MLNKVGTKAKIAKSSKIPTGPKYILYDNVKVNCNIQYIDFEGRTDGESIFKLPTGILLLCHALIDFDVVVL